MTKSILKVRNGLFSINLVHATMKNESIMSTFIQFSQQLDIETQSLSNTWSHFSCLSTKIKILPFDSHSPRIWRRRNHLSSLLITSTCWSTSPATSARPPTIIISGIWILSRANCSTRGGNVALNITICRSGRILLRIILIYQSQRRERRHTWGSNPSSSIRSASSKTTKEIRVKEISRPLFRQSKSIIRPKGLKERKDVYQEYTQQYHSPSWGYWSALQHYFHHKQLQSSYSTTKWTFELPCRSEWLTLEQVP